MLQRPFYATEQSFICPFSHIFNRYLFISVHRRKKTRTGINCTVSLVPIAKNLSIIYTTDFIIYILKSYMFKRTVLAQYKQLIKSITQEHMAYQFQSISNPYVKFKTMHFTNLLDHNLLRMCNVKKLRFFLPEFCFLEFSKEKLKSGISFFILMFRKSLQIHR